MVRAIRSVLNQTWDEVEVIVVDDGSQDSTGRYIVDAFGDDVRLLYHDRNQGVSVARNTGIAASTGEWLALLDSDDEWVPTKLERQMECLLGSGLRVGHTDEIWIRHQVRVNAPRVYDKCGGRIFAKALALCAMSPSTMIIHRDVLDEVGRFDPRLPVCEDYDMILRLACRWDVAYLAEMLTVKHGGHADQLSQAHPAMDQFRVQALDRVMRECRDHLQTEEGEAARQMLLKKARIVCNGAVKRGRTDLAATMNGYINRWE